MTRKAMATLIAAALSLALVIACPILAIANPPESYETVSGVAGADLTTDQQSADDAEAQLPAALKGETEIEKLTIAYDAARKELKEAEETIAQLQVQIEGIEKVLPEQEARSNAAIKQRYIMQSNPLAIAEPLLSSQSLDDFIRQTDYLQMISKSNLEEFNKTRALKEELANAKDEQAKVRDAADAKVAEVQEALEDEQDERANKQAEGQSESINQARTERDKKKEKSASKKSNDESDDDDESDDEDDDSDEESDDKDDESDDDDSDSDDESDDESDEDDDDDESDDNDDSDDDSDSEDEEDLEAVNRETEALIDGADWHSHRDDFLAEWAPRLDAYLEGTPLEGQGINFAASAWKYCIDPRWSAAISNTESSKGAFCIRPHNAWGWGAADSDPYNLASEWGSWEEAIDAHAAGLAKGYGYTISMRGAQSYCPPTWPSWYNKTLSEMAKI